MIRSAQCKHRGQTQCPLSIFDDFIGMGVFGNEFLKLDVLESMLMVHCVVAGWGGAKEVWGDYVLCLLVWIRLSSHCSTCTSVNIAVC
jgi:hypothetical protein